MAKPPKMICVLAALACSTAAFGQDSGWRISEADGQVSVIRDNEAIYGEEARPLQIGDVVRTSEAGRAVLVWGKEFVVVSPKAQVRIKRVEKGGVVDHALEYLGDLLTIGSQPTASKARTVALVVKGYGSSSGSTQSLAASDAKSDPSPEEWPSRRSAPADS